ncbi:hypothetical protein DXG01_009111, partial [Tephrocybe rancida]
SGPIPDEAKQRAFAIRAAFEKQIQDLAAEIGKAPQLLFSLVGEGPLLSRRPPTRWGAYEAWYGVHGEIKKTKDIASPQEWTKIVSTERDKYCKAELGDKWEDPDAVATLFEPFMAWHLEKHETYVEELKLEGTFDKVVNKVQHEYMRLAETAFKYNGVHCFGFIVNLQPDHTGRTGSAMWGATPAFQRMKTDEKEWETLLRRADMALNGDAEEHEKELCSVPITGNGRDHAQRAFLAWLGHDIGQIRHTRDQEPLEKCLKMTMPWSSWPNYAFEHKLCLIEWLMDARPPDGAYYDFKDAANGIEQVQINLSNRRRCVDYLDKSAIQIVSWKEEDMVLEIDDSDLREVPLVLSTIGKRLITVEDSAKFIDELAESKGLSVAKPKKQKGPLKKKVKRNNAVLPRHLYDILIDIYTDS